VDGDDELLTKLFHCETEHGNRLYEDRFQLFVLCRDKENHVHHVEPSDFRQIIARAKDAPSNNSEGVLSLTNILTTSLERKAYEMYAEDIAGSIRLIFYDDSIPAGDGVSVDFEETKNIHYQKYSLFKFASFLDFLCPDNIHWRGQPERESMRLVERGLDLFQKGDVHRKTAILARWIRQPGPAAFTLRLAIRSRKVAERRALLRRLEHMNAREVAQQLDRYEIKPSGYSSYVEYYEKNSDSFQAWLSKERSEARNLSKPGSANLKLS